MAKSRIGPFSLESPLSKLKSSGQVFRGIHLEQKKLAALRVFPIPMGMTPESRQAYASQLEQLKQLRHAGIVRCYGGGFDNRNAFLAYELVDGESLATQLARRDRLPWETSLDISQQLTEALQYAHQMGWIHGRIRPEKILISKDGQAKIADWRRDAIASMIDAPQSLRQLQYSAPEVLAGQAPDEKSDLYSLGAVIFTMLTGTAPYQAADAKGLMTAIQSGNVPSAGALVLDCPVWLNAIVEQLLAKDPKQRPYSSTALILAFKEAQRRQAEGVGVLQHAAAGFSPLQLRAGRDEAEKVLGIKPKKERKQRDTPFFERPLVLFAGFILAVSAVVWFLLPLSEQTLRQRAEKLLASETPSNWSEARDAYLLNMISRFPEGQHVDWANEKIEWVDAREAERRLDREERLGRTDNWSQSQIQYSEARKFERFGDMASALDKYRAIISLFGNQDEDRPLVTLAREGIERIKEQGTTDLQTFLEAKLTEAQTAYDRARVAEAKLKLESIIELYDGNQEVAPLVKQAHAQLDAMGKP